MLIRGTVFHSSNCPGSLRETDLFTHSGKCAVINYCYYGPKEVPDSDRTKGGREEKGDHGVLKMYVPVSGRVRARASTLAIMTPRY